MAKLSAAPNDQATQSVAVNQRQYALPKTPTVVVCFDGFDPAYLSHGIESGLLATMRAIKEGGGYWFASNLFSALHTAGWEASWPQAVPNLRREDVDKVMPDVSGQLFSLLLGQPPAMNAGGQPSGITVVGDGDHTALEPNAPASPFRVLFQALSKSTEFGMYGSGGSQFMPVPKGALRVVIAAKTDPIFVDNPTPQPRGTNP